MVAQALEIVKTALATCVTWFDIAIDAVNGSVFLIAVVSMVLAYKYLLSPVLGEIASDISAERYKARHPKQSGSGKKGGNNG